jgi:hypothetical protein
MASGDLGGSAGGFVRPIKAMTAVTIEQSVARYIPMAGLNEKPITSTVWRLFMKIQSEKSGKIPIHLPANFFRKHNANPARFKKRQMINGLGGKGSPFGSFPPNDTPSPVREVAPSKIIAIWKNGSKWQKRTAPNEMRRAMLESFMGWIG